MLIFFVVVRSGDLPVIRRTQNHCLLKFNILSTMEALDAVLTSLLLSEYINYAVTTREFGCSETTRRPRHQGKQRSRQDADLTTVSGLLSPP